MAAYDERPRRSFSATIQQHRHSSATVLDFYSAVHNASGTSTPPLQNSASVPFKWEQEPGKPRHGSNLSSGLNNPGPSLNPPPCMVQFVPYDTEPAGFTKLPPGSIMDGPNNLGRPKFSSSRFIRESQLDLFSNGGRKGRGGRGLFGKLKGSRREGDGSGSSFSSNSSCESEESCVRGMERHASYANLSHQYQTRSSHIWTTLYGGFKQAVHWKGSRK